MDPYHVKVVLPWPSGLLQLASPRTFASLFFAAHLLLAGCTPRPLGRVADLLSADREPPVPQASAFLEAWADDDPAAQREAANTPADFEGQQREWRQRLGILSSRFDRISVERQGPDAVTVRFRAVHTLRGLGEWEHEGRLPFERSPPDRAEQGPGRGAWQLMWTHAVLHPEARPGDRFARLRSWGARGALLDADGAPLTEGRAGARRPSPGFAHSVGRVGVITKEALETLGMPYQTGDRVGLTGLERAAEWTLAGHPAGEVRLIRASGERVTLKRFAGRDGQEVRTTLRRRVHAAAEQALEGVMSPAAIAAVDTRSGAVLALVSHPADAAMHRALTGLYPPGSTFKIITTEALVANGRGPDTGVSCPATTEVGGRRFRNFEGEVLGKTTLRRAFALSCNTTFILEGTALGADRLGAAARRFGFGAEPNVGLPSPASVFPEPRDEAELAAQAIGQGRVVATPLHMATVVAAAVTGAWHPPRLLAGKGGDPVRLEGEAAEALRPLLQAVVVEGTGKAAARVPGLAGKTGTAEFGTAQPPATHAWFAGVHGDVAFAVIVEGGGVGGRVAAPIAARFAEAL